ncbi:MAG: tail fiber domain-containing protein, partial [bacterium]
LARNTTGQSNTASGYRALFGNTNGSGNTASGYLALAGNNGFQNTASGFQALLNNTTGSYNTASGVGALQNNTTGDLNTAIGAYANVSVGNLFNATAIGYGAQVNASNKIRLGNTAVTVIEGQVPYTFTSDRNQKENFQPVDGEQVLRRIAGLSVTSWNYIGHDPQQFRHYGQVAQEFFAAFGHDAVGTIGTETTINSGDMDGILMIAAQALQKRTEEQSQQIHALWNENAALKAGNGRLAAELEQIKERLAPLASSPPR